MDFEKWLKYIFPIVDEVPTTPPTLPIGFALYKNGTTKRLYVYFLGEWTAFDPFNATILDNYLSKSNTTAFTPDADYEPATKKFVDDNVGIFGITASDILKASANTEWSGTTTGVWVKRKEIKVRLEGSLRVKFDLMTGNNDFYGRARVYINGVAVGTEHIVHSDTYATVEQDFDVNPNDLVQLYVMSYDGSANITVRNFRLYWDKAKVADYTVIQND